MIDLETTIAETLRSGDSTPIRTGSLHAGAVTRAGRIRRRRRAAVALTGLGLVVAATVTVPHLPGRADRAPDSAVPAAGQPAPARPRPQLPTTLPGVPAGAAAIDRPDAVGTDPRMLHFDVDAAAIRGPVLAWTSGRGYEGVSFSEPNGQVSTDVYIGTDAAAVDEARSWPMWSQAPDGTRSRAAKQEPATHVTVDGRPATIQRTVAEGIGTFSWTLRWQPSAGLHALVQVFGVDRTAAFETVKAIRLDRAQRCVVPVRLTALPAGWSPSACTTSIRRTPAGPGGRWASSQISLATPGGGKSSVWLEDASARSAGDLKGFKANRTVAGHPAQWRTADPRGLWIPHFGAAEVLVEGATEADSLAVGAGLTLAGDLRDPGTWPQP